MHTDRLVELATTVKTAVYQDGWLLPDKKELLARWAAPLAVCGAIIPGLTLHIELPFSRAGEFDRLTARLVQRSGGYVWHLGRIEFAPTGPPPHHRNSHPALMRTGRFRPTLDGAHAHLAEDNAILGAEAFRPPADLPAAREIDWSGGFLNAISTISILFCIEGLWCGDELPWDRRLF